MVCKLYVFDMYKDVRAYVCVSMCVHVSVGLKEIFNDILLSVGLCTKH